MRVLENLEVIEVANKKMFRCAKCGYELGSVTENFQERALKHEAPISKFQQTGVISKTDRFVLREYYCPQCATMFEVVMAAKEGKEIASMLLKERRQ